MKHPSPRVFFEAHAGELGLGAWLGFRLHLMRCERCRTRWDEEHAAAESAVFDDRVDARLRAAGVTGTKKDPTRWIMIPALAGVLVLLLVFFFRGPDRVHDDGGETLRPKGGTTSTFLVYVSPKGGDGGVDLLGPTCAPGDALQAQYRTNRKQVLVVGVDPAGEARVLAPLDGKTSAPTTIGLQSLPQSWVLDEAKGRERFVAFFSDAPIDAARATAAAKAEKPALEGTIAVVRECTKR